MSERRQQVKTKEAIVLMHWMNSTVEKRKDMTLEQIEAEASEVLGRPVTAKVLRRVASDCGCVWHKKITRTQRTTTADRLAALEEKVETLADELRRLKEPYWQ